MHKPNDLKRILLASIPQLRDSPDRVLVFTERGRVRCTAATSLSFEYAYDLRIIITSFSGSPDAVFLPILGWARTQQSELLANLDKVAQGIQYEAEIIDKHTIDLSITLPLTERVIVKLKGDGTYDVTHAGEPQYEPYEPHSPMRFIVDGELLAEWTPPPPPDGMALSTPHPKRPAHD